MKKFKFKFLKVKFFKVKFFQGQKSPFKFFQGQKSPEKYARQTQFKVKSGLVVPQVIRATSSLQHVRALARRALPCTVMARAWSSRRWQMAAAWLLAFPLFNFFDLFFDLLLLVEHRDRIQKKILEEK